MSPKYAGWLFSSDVYLVSILYVINVWWYLFVNKLCTDVCTICYIVGQRCNKIQIMNRIFQKW